MKLRNKLIATIVSISMVLAVIGVGAWASTESFTATITNTVNLEFDNIKGQIGFVGQATDDDVATDDLSIEEMMYDGSDVIYNQISSADTNGTNLYWEGTQFFDSSEDGAGILSNETSMAALGYIFIYQPTEACVGTSTISVLVNEINVPEITGGKIIIRYFATTDTVYWTEMESGIAITPISDNEIVLIMAVCQYHNPKGVSVSTIASSWDFELTFSAGSAPKEELSGDVVLSIDSFATGEILPYNYVSPGVERWEIIEFGEYPQTIKAAGVSITSETPDEDGYYPGSDGARYAKQVFSSGLSIEGGVTASDGTVLQNNETYYFKVEPIKWRVLKTENGESLIVADKILDNTSYQGSLPGDNFIDGLDGVYRNNYKHSVLRSKLNGEFYNTAFSDAEKSRILVTEVDNSAATTDNPLDNQYVCENTNDKVFALSYADLTNPDYQFSPNINTMDLARRWYLTDFALLGAVGLGFLSEGFIENSGVDEVQKAQMRLFLGAHMFWSRSPYSGADGSEWPEVTYSRFGEVGSGVDVYDKSGMVPAMVITR